MELIIIIVAIISIIIIHYLMKCNLRELEKIATNNELNIIAEKYPANIEICKTILKKLNNENVKIEEDQNSNSTLYLAIQDKITIGNTRKSYTRIQTMAHECLHSIQDKKILIFNVIYSNIYLLYFVLISILVILKKLQNELVFSNILLILSLIYYTIRIYLENDAMIKAEYLAKEYMEGENISTKSEIEKIANSFKVLNNGAIKATNCQIFINIMIKVVIFNTLALIF